MLKWYLWMLLKFKKWFLVSKRKRKWRNNCWKTRKYLSMRKTSLLWLFYAIWRATLKNTWSMSLSKLRCSTLVLLSMVLSIVFSCAWYMLFILMMEKIPASVLNTLQILPIPSQFGLLSSHAPWLSTSFCTQKLQMEWTWWNSLTINHICSWIMGPRSASF